MRLAFRLLRPDDLDGSFDSWMRAVVPMVQEQRVLSSTLAGAYYSELRNTQLGAGFDPVLAGPVNAEALSTSMLVTGPISIKEAMKRNLRLAAALGIAESGSARAAMRHALNGGRETLLNTMRADRASVGWRRVTSGNPCKFCSMLASRGGVYSATTADFEAHDGCSCSAEPVWR